MKGLTLNHIETYINNSNYLLLSTEYKNVKTKLKIQCPEGHIFEMRYNDFQQGQRCPECANKIKGNYNKLDYMYIKQKIEDDNYKLLSKKYKNNSTKLELQCSKGHVYLVAYRSFQQGQRCPECANKIKGNYNKLTLEEVKDHIESFNYKLISTEYKNALTKLKLQCPEGHIYKVSYNNFQRGRRCPECSLVLKWSKPEKEIVEYIKTIYSGKIIENDRTLVKNYWTGCNLELDVLIPEINKAIEFNGLYWHNDDYIKWKDEMKKKQCIKKGIDLLVINELDWYDDRSYCLNNIKMFIGF